MLHHGWWLRVIDVDLRLFRRGWQDRQLCCLPFYYADPAIQLLTSLASRGTLVAMRRFSVSRFWEVVTRYDATEILSIASIPALLMKGEPGPAELDHRIRLAIHAGLPKELHEEMVKRYGFHWHNQYGSTEGGVMSRVPHYLADELVGTGTMGVEPPGVTIRIVDDNDNDQPGEAGEALIGGPDLYAGYLNRPEVTAEANKGGWYHSGDVVRRDERGLLYFVGRKKEIIRRNGENISAAELEGVMRSHPAVIDAAVVAVPDTLRGEEVKVYVQVKDGESFPPEAVIEFCKQNLAAFKIPRFIEFRNTDFERTPSMRVHKQSLLKAKPDLRAAPGTARPERWSSRHARSSRQRPCDLLIVHRLRADHGRQTPGVRRRRHRHCRHAHRRRRTARRHRGGVEGRPPHRCRRRHRSSRLHRRAYHAGLHLSRGSITDNPNPPKDEGGAGPGVFTRWINAIDREDEYASALMASAELACNGFTGFVDASTSFSPDAIAAATEP